MKITLEMFYRDIDAAVKADPDNRPSWFRPFAGLCYNLQKWTYELHNSYESQYVSLALEMDNQFKASGLDECYPFNNCAEGDEDYNSETDVTRWKNVKRLAWVADHI